jgi:excisionase family DNA binding protein
MSKLAVLEQEIERLKEIVTLDPKRAAVAEGVMSVEDAMGFTNLSRGEVYNLMDSGRLPFLKHGRRRLIPRKSVIDFLASLSATE